MSNYYGRRTKIFISIIYWEKLAGINDLKLFFYFSAIIRNLPALMGLAFLLRIDVTSSRTVLTNLMKLIVLQWILMTTLVKIHQ